MPMPAAITNIDIAPDVKGKILTIHYSDQSKLSLTVFPDINGRVSIDEVLCSVERMLFLTPGILAGGMINDLYQKIKEAGHHPSCLR